MAKCSAASNAAQRLEARAGDHSTKGGSSETDAKLFAVIPKGPAALLQVTIDDAVLADQTFDMLMGSEVAPRRRFITTHANEVRNLDV